MVPPERTATIWNQRRCWSRLSLFAGVTNSLRPVAVSLVSLVQDQPGLSRVRSPAPGESLHTPAPLGSARKHGGPSRPHMGPYANPPGSRAEWSQQEWFWHSGRQRRLSSLTGSSTLEASSLQHLLVLLLSHALAALLNERSHGGATVAVRRAPVRNDTTQRHRATPQCNATGPDGSVQGGLGIPIRSNRNPGRKGKLGGRDSNPE